MPKAVQWSKDNCLSLRFDINDHWVVKLEGHLMDGLNAVNVSLTDEEAAATNDPEEEWSMFAIKISYSF